MEPNRGFIDDWNPHDNTRQLLTNVLEILDLYHDQRPLTLRQIYYRLIAKYLFPKSDESLKRLMTHMATARRARWRTNDGVLLFDVIRDDTAIRHPANFFNDAADYLDAARRFVRDHFRLDRQDGQPRRIVLWCEAAGMVPQLRRIAEEFGNSVYCGGGFDGLTDKYLIGGEWAKSRQPITVLHIGDHDPSGVHLFQALAEDIIAFADALKQRVPITRPPTPPYGDIEFVRLAITPQQVIDYHLEELSQPRATSTKPGKLWKDDRRFDRFLVRLHGDDATWLANDETVTWQAEALPPDVLATIIRDAIEERLDADQYEQMLTDEDETRQDLIDRLEQV